MINAVGRKRKDKLWYRSCCSKYAEDGQKKVPHNQRGSQLKWWSVLHEILSSKDHEKIDSTGPPADQLPVLLHPHPILRVFKFLFKIEHIGVVSSLARHLQLHDVVSDRNRCQDGGHPDLVPDCSVQGSGREGSCRSREQRQFAGEMVKMIGE